MPLIWSKQSLQYNTLFVKIKKDPISSSLQCAKRRPTLTGGIPQLPSALKSLTSVFGMGTGVTSLPSSLHLHMDVLASALSHGCDVFSRRSFLSERIILSKLDKRFIVHSQSLVKSSTD